MDIIVFDNSVDFLGYMKNAFAELNAKHCGAFGSPIYMSDPGGVLAYAETNQARSTVYILDIVTDDMEETGFDLGKEIKGLNLDNLIIYVTDYEEKIIYNMTHKILSLGFILKASARLHEDLEEVLLEAKNTLEDPFFSAIRQGYDIVKYKMEDIYYFKRKKEAEYTHIFSKNDCIAVKESLRSIKKRLNSDFCYSAKGFIVNRKAIKNVDRTKKILYFDDGYQCPYSWIRQREVLKCF